MRGGRIIGGARKLPDAQATRGGILARPPRPTTGGSRSRWDGWSVVDENDAIRDNQPECSLLRLGVSSRKETIDERHAGDWGAGSRLYAPLASRRRRPVVEPAGDEGRDLL